MPTDFNGITGNLTLISPNGEQIELGEIERVEMTPSSSSYTLSSSNDSDFTPFNSSATGTIQLQPISNSNLQDSVLTTVPTLWDSLVLNETISNGYIAPITRNTNDDIADLMEDYIRNRNQDDKIFINHNTCQRKIEYNLIDDVIEFRARLDEIIKQHYQDL